VKKYFGIVLLRTENLTSHKISYDETYLSIKALNTKDAENILEEYAVSCETSYKNQDDELIVIKVEKIIDVNEYLREESEERFFEIYSRNFDDIEAYSKFEKLYKK